MIGKIDNLKNTERKNTEFGFYLDKRMAFVVCERSGYYDYY